MKRKRAWLGRHRLGGKWAGRWEYEAGLRIGAFSIQFYWLREPKEREEE